MTIWFMPFASKDGISTFAYILAVLFWVFFVFGVCFLSTVSKRRKNDRKYRQKGSFTFIRFFSNRPAQIFDTLLIVGLATVILSSIIRTMPGWITLPAVFISMFSLEMHGLFNGKNYEYMCVVNRF